eukprot:GHVT01088448.1.p3 GENE.GHVT01088448.1~~GHVT01088448.1.p3  ORF type:complete len:104 (+),score=28.61 GHVT01088448.1:502-813(+)
MDASYLNLGPAPGAQGHAQAELPELPTEPQTLCLDEPTERAGELQASGQAASGRWQQPTGFSQWKRTAKNTQRKSPSAKDEATNNFATFLHSTFQALFPQTSS